jgi:hypothetical protein
MFGLCCVFGALLSERSPHLKRKMNIVLFFALSIYKASLHILSYCLLFLIYNYIFYIPSCVSIFKGYTTSYILLSYTWLCCQFSRVKEHFDTLFSPKSKLCFRLHELYMMNIVIVFMFNKNTYQLTEGNPCSIGHDTTSGNW